MKRGLPDNLTVETAVALATRAPSIHNSQPWQWRVGDRSLHLYADLTRQLPQTDPDGRDLTISCGAALHHLRIAFLSLGWRAEVHRLPNPDDPTHLAAIELHRHEPTEEEIKLAAAISHRRTDRRRHSSWPVPPNFLDVMTRRAADEGVILRAVTGSSRDHLVRAIREASRRHRSDPAYATELAMWSGRHLAVDGVPAGNATAVEKSGHAIPQRDFADPRLAQAIGAAEQDNAALLLVLDTPSDDPMSRLRAGEATSAVLLTATRFGLASCPLTEPLELPDVRALVSRGVSGSRYPQMVLNIGWAPTNAESLPITPRRELAEVLRSFDEQSDIAASHQAAHHRK